MQIRTFLITLFASVALAAVNEPCYGPGGIAGVCVSTASCKASGGTSISGACPKDAANIKCCSKPKCKNGTSGNCRWVSDCAGGSVSGQCPGPSAMKCCSSRALGFGGYKAPVIPRVGVCRQVAVNGARTVVAQFPGKVREIGCYRTAGCKVAKPSDHCSGRAIDFMISDKGGMATSSGKGMAEWIMRNNSKLRLKYVIWGQRIWETSVDKVKPWDQWKPMNGRGDITANHWDHVHASFKA